MHRLIGDRSLGDTWLDAADARAAYRDMVRARRFDDRALALQRRGWMSGYPPFRGQEAAQVGAAHAMRDDDWLVPTYRSNALQIARGVPMRDLLRFRRGFPEFGSDHDLPALPQAIPIGSQLPHAVGIGLARNYVGGEEAALACFGDGATSQGDTHEAMNFAGVFGTPTVFFCENNGWAISHPRDRQTASETIAGKAEAYGFEGVQVDGNDPLAVREVVTEALASARDGSPVLVEALTYRQGAHTTADDPDRYRPREPDLPDWRTRDPLDRFEAFLREEGVVDDAFAEETRARADDELAEAVAAAEETTGEGAGDPDDLFDAVYATPTRTLDAQRQALRASLDRDSSTDEDAE
jgi:pyruvate dehydrogenase E1 component alpha subunit